MGRRKWRRPGAVVALLLAAWAAAPAAGQDVSVLSALREWHAKLTDPHQAASVEDGRAAQERLAEWNLPLGELPPEARAQALRLEIHAALAVGNAGRAAEWLPELERTEPDTRETLRTAWLVAGAAGDAALGQRTLERLREKGWTSAAHVTTRLERLRLVGRAAPDVEVTPVGGRPLALRRRAGSVLVLDFVKPGAPQGEREAGVLRGLHAALAGPQVQFLSISLDDSGDVGAGGGPAAGREPAWPHCRGAGSGAAAAARALGVDPPCVVVVDIHGNVRAAERASDPALVYALRAAAAEARGAHRPLRPRALDGSEAPPPPPVERAGAAEPEAPGGRDAPAGPGAQAEPKSGERVVPPGELPSSPEARSLLDRARAYIKTGLKREARKLLEEIIEKYPGTREAADAKERLELL